METTPRPRLRWLRLTPDRLVVGLLAVEGLLGLSQRFRWFAFNEHKGWTVLIAVAGVGVFLLLMFVWFVVALIFRRRFQYSIRSLLVLTVAVAIPCSWLAAELKAARKQRAAVEEIRKVGGKVLYDHEFGHAPQLPGREWLYGRFGIDLLEDVKWVLAYDNLEVGDAEMEQLKGFPQLQFLDVMGANVSDVGMEHLEGLGQLQMLSLQRTKIGDAGLEHLKGLAQLCDLGLGGTKVSDAGLEHLKGLTQLNWLDLNGTKVSGAGLEDLKGLIRLQMLDLRGTKVSGAGLEHLGGLTQLQRLYLDGTKVGDAGLEHLKGLTQLHSLDLGGTKVTDAGVRKLQKALPKVQITR